MSEKDTLGKVMLDIFLICGLSEEAAIELMKTVKETVQEKNEVLELENEAKKVAGHNVTLQKSIITLMKDYGLTAVEALELIDKLSNPGDIADVMQCVYTSGEDPGDTHEPSKVSGTIDYDGLISAVAGHLDVNDWSEFNRLIREHKELTSEQIMPIEPYPKFKPKPFNMYADGQTPELVETAYEAREAQVVKFANKDIVIHTKEETLCTLSIEEMLEKCYLMSIGNKLKLDDKVYMIELVGATSGIDQTVYVQVKEMKRYE